MKSPKTKNRFFEVQFYVFGGWKVYTTYIRKTDALALAARMKHNGDTTRVVEVTREEVR